MKARLADYLKQRGHEVTEVEIAASDSLDYPDIASDVSSAVAAGRVDRGLLICGTGIGMAITANKLLGVRAAVCPDEATAAICRRHNDVNVLCLAGAPDNPAQTERIVDVWLETPFDGGRHARRLEKISAIEQRERGSHAGGSGNG